MQGITGVDHVILRVSDSTRAKQFYEEVLGFETQPLGGGPDAPFRFRTGNTEFFVGAWPQTQQGDRFDETRIGMDHVAWTVTDRATLDTLAERLLAAGVDTKGIELFAPSGNYYIALRDPDNIQLEFWLTK